MATKTIYQFYANLFDFEPEIWRRFQVASDIAVAQIGYIVQVLFEMRASHLMSIEVPVSRNQAAAWKAEHPKKPAKENPYAKENIRVRYEVRGKNPQSFFGPDIEESKDATKSLLHDVVSNVGDQLAVWYDFGDDWIAVLMLEKVLDNKDQASELPHVMEGAGFGIVEDVGGPMGLHELAEAFKKKKGEQYKMYCEWLGKKDFDITAFDLDDMNFRLKKIPKIYQQIYENSKYPSKASIDLIERKYLVKKKPPAAKKKPARRKRVWMPPKGK
jgi:hypothetical protein